MAYDSRVMTRVRWNDWRPVIYLDPIIKRYLASRSLPENAYVPIKFSQPLVRVHDSDSRDGDTIDVDITKGHLNIVASFEFTDRVADRN